ncbi:MAG TPA: septum formation inhibitor Maf [Clostridiaceae bacterium]|nr:septum formation inhibitor Maf [Clostridiaceae bacterium]
MKDIILASASPRRYELLKQIGLEFEVVPSDVDEDADTIHAPEELVKELAYKKALSVAKMLNRQCPARDALVIGADTIVVKDGILGKPQNEQSAYEMLKSLGGGWHDVITGISVVSSCDLRSFTDFEKTRVKMRPFDDRIIRNYINTREPQDKAGAYGIQGMGALLVERIEGCYFNVVGLPLFKLSRVLEKFGVYVL